MATDKMFLDRLTLDLHNAIIDNGGVECEQVPDVFFPEDWATRTKMQSTNMYNLAIKTAREICFRCPVMDKCLKVGMFEEYGIWGGTTPQQRIKIRKQRSD